MNTAFLDDIIRMAQRVWLKPFRSQGPTRIFFELEAPADIVSLCGWPLAYKYLVIKPIENLQSFRIKGPEQYIELGFNPGASPFWLHLKTWPGGNNDKGL